MLNKLVSAIDSHLMTKGKLCDTCSQPNCYRNTKIGKLFLIITKGL